MSEYRFEIGVRCPVAPLSSAVRDVEGALNKSMAGFGFSEKLVITSVVPLVLTVARMPTDAEMAFTRAAIEKEFSDKFGPSKVEYVKALPGKEE